MAIENNLKCSEFDENYYAMLIENSKPTGKKLQDNKINPACRVTGVKDNITIYTPMNKELTNYQFTDFFYFDYNVFVSEKIKTQLEGIIPSFEDGVEGPCFYANPVYLKTGEDHLAYCGLFFPKYKFVDKKHLQMIDGSRGVVYHGDSTSGLEDITHISLKAGMVKKMPKNLRMIFELDFHKLGWIFCVKEIKEKIESLNATGVQFEKSKDRNWHKEE